MTGNPDASAEPNASLPARRKETRPILVYHPFLLGAFPVLSMLSTNIGEAEPSECLLPLAAVMVVAGVVWLGLRPVLPDPHKRGIVLSLFWIPFYAFGPVVGAVRAAFQFQHLLAPVQLASVGVIALAVCAYPLYRLRRSPWSFRRATPVLNAIAISAVLVASAMAGYRLLEQHQYVVPEMPEQKETRAASGGAAGYPDIYYVIVDAYARADYMKKAFDYDNGPFVAALRGRGFYVADRTHSNYMSTPLSLSSSLNLRHHEEAMIRLSWDNWNAAVPKFVKQVWVNGVVDFLKQRGYEFVTFASGIQVTEIRSADRYFLPPERESTDFQRKFVELTPLRVVLNRIPKPKRPHRALFVLDELTRLKRAGRPMFVFAHLMAPHLPHRFDAEGRTLTQPPPYKEGYRDEVIYLNKRLLEFVDATLARQPNSVIVIQGDHGPWTNWRSEFGLYVPPWRGTWDDYVRDRTAMLNAYYFPDKNYEGWLYPDITPVNSFRMIFNKFFGTHFERLEDVSYIFSDDGKLARITQVF